MYNLVFGQNPLSLALLATLNLKASDVGRFRDCYLSDGKIAVYTRNGGGNRNCWGLDGCDNFKHDHDCMVSVIERLRDHPCYESDEDDDFDCTYATFFFRFPDEYAEELKQLDSGETINPSERWLKAIESLRNA